MKIVVIGGSGLIGSQLTKKLRDRGHEAVAASPKSGVNAVTGEGLANALVGADIGVDVANAPSWDDGAAAMGDFTLSKPANRIVKLAGPEPIQIDEIVRQFLREQGDAREVITDDNAPYYGIVVSKRSLMPGEGARLAPTRFADWLRHTAPRPHAMVS